MTELLQASSEGHIQEDMDLGGPRSYSPGGGGGGAGPQEIKLRVYDEGLQTEKEFFCETKLLLAHMSYFKKYLTESDDTDILIHCDIYVFSWLMKYVKATDLEDLPALNEDNCLPVLIASNFLEMDTLVGECISYIADHFRELLRMPTDLSFLTQELVVQLADEISVVTLEEVWQEVESAERHPKSTKSSDEIKSLGVKNLLDKLYEHKLSLLISSSGDTYAWCTTCNKLYCKAFQGDLTCSQARVRVDLRGEVNVGHQPSPSWKLENSLQSLKEVCHHRHLYWFFWSKATQLKCLVCKESFMASDIRKRNYHPKKALYPPTELCGYYLCCKKDASKFNSMKSGTPNLGCKEREHQLDYTDMTHDEQKMVSLFKQQQSNSLPMYSELDSFNFAGTDGSSKDVQGKPESLVASNVNHFFDFLRNHTQHSRNSSDVKLRLFGQNYQESLQSSENVDRSQKARRSILHDALHNIDSHRLGHLLTSLSKKRK